MRAEEIRSSVPADANGPWAWSSTNLPSASCSAFCSLSAADLFDPSFAWARLYGWNYDQFLITMVKYCWPDLLNLRLAAKHLNFCHFRIDFCLEIFKADQFAEPAGCHESLFWSSDYSFPGWYPHGAGIAATIHCVLDPVNSISCFSFGLLKSAYQKTCCFTQHKKCSCAWVRSVEQNSQVPACSRSQVDRTHSDYFHLLHLIALDSILLICCF